MTKREYAELLKTEEWKKKRIKILKRDGFLCTQCKSTEELQVHHLWYPKGKKPWEIEDKYLVTLCGKCHEGEHNLHSLSEFFKKPIVKEGNVVKRLPSKKARPKIKKKKPKKKKLTRKQRIIQNRYNELRKQGKLPPR